MKLSVSNIAWETPRMEEFLDLLRRQGCDGLELSPSMVWEEPVDVPIQEIEAFGRKVRSFGLEFSSIHSLTYTRPDLTFFDSKDSRKRLISYIIEMGHIANMLMVPVMVFGSAKSRQIEGRPRAQCYKIMADSLHSMAKALEGLGVMLLIEPLGKKDSDCVNNAEDAMNLIRTVGHKNFAMHIDLRTSFAEKENHLKVWRNYVSYIKHCHVSNPGMKVPGPDCAEHRKASKAIRASGYDLYISIEAPRVNSLPILEDAIRFVKSTYFEGDRY